LSETTRTISKLARFTCPGAWEKTSVPTLSLGIIYSQIPGFVAAIWPAGIDLADWAANSYASALSHRSERAKFITDLI
jgi:hypothetical protein